MGGFWGGGVCVVGGFGGCCWVGGRVGGGVGGGVVGGGGGGGGGKRPFCCRANRQRPRAGARAADQPLVSLDNRAPRSTDQ